MKIVFLCVFLLIGQALSCNRPGGPLPQASIDNFVKNFIASRLPLYLPDVTLSVKGVLYVGVTDTVVKTADFTANSLTLPKANQLVFRASGMTGSMSLNFDFEEGTRRVHAAVILGIVGAQLTIINNLLPDRFNVSDASFTVQDLILKASNQPDIEPYWEVVKPLAIDLLSSLIPDALERALSTDEIHALVTPIIRSLEPIHIPDINASFLGIYGGFSKAALNGIDFAVATLERGSNDNEVTLALSGVSATIRNNWEFKDSLFGIDKTGSGIIKIRDTSLSLTLGLGSSPNGLTVNLDDSNLDLGKLNITISGTDDDKIINWLIQFLEPLVVQAIHDSFNTVLCFLFDFAPSLYAWK